MYIDAKALIVGGTFDENRGKRSSLLQIFTDSLEFTHKSTLNGGNLKRLEQTLEEVVNYDVVVWMPNIPDNSLPKIVRDIKRKNPKVILITSKRCIEKNYNDADVITHGLRNKSNLILKIVKQGNAYVGRVLDPLGNDYTTSAYKDEYIRDFSVLGNIITRRVEKLLGFTRTPSIQVEEEKPQFTVEPEFIDIIHKSAEEFSKLLPVPSTNTRFLGNASFRCGKGFPSFKTDEFVMVSRRNVNKEGITEEDFVPVVPNTLPIKYYGPNKPSVDTPIQVMLYMYYKKAKYMLHGHVEVEGAPYKTHSPIPCGSLEEFNEIIRHVPDENEVNFSINLNGHGFLIIADNLDYFRGATFRAREYPTIQEV